MSIQSLSFFDQLNTEIKDFLSKEENLNSSVEEERDSFKKYVITTDSSKYTLYVQKNDMSCPFLKVIQVAAKLHLGPHLIVSDDSKKQMLCVHMVSQTWPTFTENPNPYFDAIRLLKVFHENTKVYKPVGQSEFSPYAKLIETGEKMSKSTLLPKHFHQAIVRVKLIHMCLSSYLQKNATFFHGDFCKETVTFDGRSVFVNDWKKISWGDPLFDLVEFSFFLGENAQEQLFTQYLGAPPTPQDQVHFHLVKLTYIVILVLQQLESAYTQNAFDEEFYSKKDMEDLLDNPNSLKSFKPNSDRMKLQLSAFSLLTIFLQGTSQSSSFHHFLHFVATKLS